MPDKKTSPTRVVSLILSLVFFFVFLVLVYLGGIFFISTSTQTIDPSSTNTADIVSSSVRLVSIGVLGLSIASLVLSVISMVAFIKSNKHTNKG
ncbi:MAG: hypothetical protein WAZ21_03395 [Candidatus Saccharimonadales bacterium]